MAAKRSVTKTPRVEPDADAPLSDAEFERGYGAMLARRARAATGLSQRAFAARFGVPVGTLRDWEQGRRAPDAATQGFLKVIAKIPNAVMKALRRAA
jgi:putative transcriptional regulator